LSTKSRRAAQVAAVTLGLATLGIGLATAPLDSLTHATGTGGPLADTLSNAAAVIPTVAVATVLAARRPHNPIGWMIFAILIVGFSPTSEYAILDYRMDHGTLPFGGLTVVLQEAWPMFLVFIAILLWIFPDGTLPEGRWRRPSVVLVVAGLLLGLAASAPGLVAVAGHDVRLSSAGDLTTPMPVVWNVFGGIVIVGVLASWLAWLAFQIPTYRHASGERRQQLKWLYSGAVIFVVTLVIGVFIVPVSMGEAPGWGTQPVVNDVGTLALAALPVCMGVAVLKYRLYDLDRVISRVVSYAVITALLAGVYVGLILLATHVLPFRGPVAVAASTLVTAALFNPLRKRVQHLVDRRFNRSRYDAEAVVAAFTARLRHTVDLDAVHRDLVGVVGEAFQPTAVSMWLAPAPGQEPRPLAIRPYRSGRQQVAGFEQGLEVGQDAWPSLRDAVEHGTSGVEVIVYDGQLDQLAERFDVEGHLRTALAADPGQVVVADLISGRPFWRERVPGIGEPPVRVGFEHDLSRIGDFYPLVEFQGQGRSGLPVGLPGDIPVALGEGGIRQPLPEPLGRGADVGRVDKFWLAHRLWLAHRRVLQGSLQVRERVHAPRVVVVDPAFGDLADRGRVEVVQLFAASPEDGHEAGGLQDRQVLADGLPGHVQAGAQFAQGLPAAAIQAVEQAPAAWVRQRPEYLIHSVLLAFLNMQPSGCVLMVGSRLAACQPARGGAGAG
jgi:hypothetical protein